MANEGKYIYGIIATDEAVNFKQPGIEEEPEVYTINYDDIAAVVSDTSLAICDPTRKNMSSHNRVLEAVMKGYTVLPARFGLISDNEDKLRGLLAEYYPALKDYVRKLDKRMEVGVKVFWKKEQMLAILEGKDQKLHRLQQEIKEASPARAQVLLLEAGKLVKAQANEWQIKYADHFYMRLMRVAVDGRRNYPIDISNTLNASFLVDKAREKEFDAAIDELDAEHGGWASFKCVKPMPAYDFVSLEMYLH